jgi:hypothetical protein
LRYSGGRIGVVDDPAPMKLANVLDLDFNALAQGEVKFKHTSSCAILLYGETKGSEIVRYTDTYVGFVLPEGMQMLHEYLEERIRKGELLTPSNYLFGAEREQSGYLNHVRLGDLVAKLSKAAGFTIADEQGKQTAKFTAHSLRRLFYNTLQGLEDVDKEGLSGHVKGVRARYHGSVDELPKVVEFMRQKYEYGMRHLVTVTSAEDQRKRAVIDYARMQGLSDEQIRKKHELKRMVVKHTKHV